jgi:hypothetical protein
MSRPLRVLMIASHPVQYASPLFRLFAKDSRLEIQVAYGSLQGVQARVDRDFGVEVEWDIPLLEGYPWLVLRNRSSSRGLGSFFSLTNPGIWRLIRHGAFDAVVFYMGYVHATFWMGLAAAKTRGLPVLFATDAHATIKPGRVGSRNRSGRDFSRWQTS